MWLDILEAGLPQNRREADIKTLGQASCNSNWFKMSKWMVLPSQEAWFHTTLVALPGFVLTSSIIKQFKKKKHIFSFYFRQDFLDFGVQCFQVPTVVSVLNRFPWQIWSHGARIFRASFGAHLAVLHQCWWVSSQLRYFFSYYFLGGRKVWLCMFVCLFGCFLGQLLTLEWTASIFFWMTPILKTVWQMLFILYGKPASIQVHFFLLGFYWRYFAGSWWLWTSRSKVEVEVSFGQSPSLLVSIRRWCHCCGGCQSWRYLHQWYCSESFERNQISEGWYLIIGDTCHIYHRDRHLVGLQILRLQGAY